MNKNLDAPTFTVGFREFEFTKFVDNSFHALKVAYANEIGRLFVNLGIDAKVVHKILSLTPSSNLPLVTASRRALWRVVPSQGRSGAATSLQRHGREHACRRRVDALE